MVNKKGNVYNFWRLIKMIFGKMPFLSFIAFVIPLVSGLLTVFIYSSQAKIINIVSYGISSSKWQDILISISSPLLTIVFISVIQAISNLIEKVSGNKLKEKITLIFQSEIINITNSVQYVNFDDKDFCNKLQRAKAVVGEDLVSILFNFTAAVKISASLINIILLSAFTRLYSISFVIIVMIAVYLFVKMSAELKVRKLNRELTLEGRMGDYLSNTLTSSNVIREMRIYNSSDFFFNLWGNIITGQNNKRMNARREEIKLGIICITIQTITIFIVLVVLINNIYTSTNITVGLIATLFLALVRSGWQITSLTWPLSKLYVSCSRLYDFHEFLSIKNELCKNSKEEKKELLPITMINVSFSYKNSESQALRDISLTINKNEKIAVVGANGAGKSTLIKLLLGLYSPSEGLIKWNESCKAPLRIAAVFQNFIKFELTLRENVALGNIEQMNNDELILEIMKKCKCYDLYEELGSLDVPLGRIMEGGRELSGGQWQRLAISRAVLCDSDIIILDEPTASIDPNTEADIFNSIIKLCKDKTAIFISHRLGWAKNADRIIVLNDGSIAETGNHKELMALGGIYSKMYGTQASWYKELLQD